MPSLFRLLLILGLIGGTIYAGLFSLATFVNPKPREITVIITPDKFARNR